MDYYSVSLNLRNKKAVVIGGGKIAERKVVGLSESGAVITVISPDISENLYKMVQSGTITWLKKSFSADDLKNAFLIIAATDKSEVNLKVKEAAAPNQLISIVDNPAQSNFILPSVIKRGKLHITVSTSGASPLLAKKLKQEISEQYGEEYKEYVDFLFSCRQTILKEIKDDKIKQKLLSAITDPSFLTSTNRQQEFSQLLKHHR